MVHKNLDEIIESIKSTITEKYQLIKKEDMKADSLISAIIEALALEIFSAYTSMDSLESNNRVGSANKAYLDMIGNSVGLYRKGGQSDESYRYDIVSWYKNNRTAGASAIEKAIRDTDGVYTYSIDNLAYGAGTFAVHVQTKDSANTSYVAEQLYNNINEVVAEGVLFKVITPKDVNVEIELIVAGDQSPLTISTMKAAIRNYVTSVKPGESLYVNKIESVAISSSPKIASVYIVNTKLNGRYLYSKEAKLLTDEQFRISDNNIVLKQ